MKPKNKIDISVEKFIEITGFQDGIDGRTIISSNTDGTFVVMDLFYPTLKEKVLLYGGCSIVDRDKFGVPSCFVDEKLIAVYKTKDDSFYFSYGLLKMSDGAIGTLEIMPGLGDYDCYTIKFVPNCEKTYDIKSDEILMILESAEKKFLVIRDKNMDDKWRDEMVRKIFAKVHMVARH